MTTLQVRQISEYPMRVGAAPSDAVLLQVGGLGGPYVFTTSWGLVEGACGAGGPLGVGVSAPADAAAAAVFSGGFSALPGGGLMWNLYGGNPSLRYWSSGRGAALTMAADGSLNFLAAPPGAAAAAAVPAALTVTASLTATGYLTVADQVLVGRDPVAPDEVATKAYADFLWRCTVASFNGRRGIVVLTLADVVLAGGAPVDSPCFTGCPQAPTIADPDQADCQVANAAFVQRVVFTKINDLLSGHPFVFRFNGRSGAVCLTIDDIIAAGGAPLDSPAFTGVPTAPTAPAGTATDQIATTAFVMEMVAAGAVSSFNGRTGIVTLTLGDITAAGGAPLASPAFSGAPSAPTAPAGTATGQLATTAFVMNAITESTTGVASFNGRTGTVTLTLADITAAGGAPLASPAFTGVPTAPTAPVGTQTDQIATTAFVLAEVAAVSAGVTTFNGRSGAVTLTLADITTAGGAPLAGPAFTGVPTAATAAPGTATTQLATTAFVTAAVAASVTSFNGRTGAVSLNANDITAAGGLAAVTASAPLTGSGTAAAPLGLALTVAGLITGAGTAASPLTASVATDASLTGAGTPGAPLSVVTRAPTVQRFAAGSGTYTPTAATVKWSRVRMCGGGGGGGGGGPGGGGGTTSFAAWTAVGGGPGNGPSGASGGAGGPGGTGGAAGTGTLVVRLPGGDGQGGLSNATANVVGFNPRGGSGPFGSEGAPGAGGAAGSGVVGSVGTAGSGGAGEYVEFIVTAPAPAAYTVGAAGTAGAVSPGVVGAGAPGAAGIIIVEEHY